LTFTSFLLCARTRRSDLCSTHVGPSRRSLWILAESWVWQCHYVYPQRSTGSAKLFAGSSGATFSGEWSTFERWILSGIHQLDMDSDFSPFVRSGSSGNYQWIELVQNCIWTIYYLWFTFSTGGLLVTAVMKYADNLLKGFAMAGYVALSSCACEECRYRCRCCPTSLVAYPQQLSEFDVSI